MSDKQEYPKFLHHASKRARLVHSAAEQAALGSEWAESPLVHGIVTHPPPGTATTDPGERDRTRFAGDAGYR